jgi:hypothetical protein
MILCAFEIDFPDGPQKPKDLAELQRSRKARAKAFGFSGGN